MTSEQRDRDRETVEEVWATHRRRLLDIGYRMLGSISDAEDIAGEAYARLLEADVDRIDDVAGWLVTVTSRLCVDRLRSADRRRRAYVGPWLPEPVLSSAESGAHDPSERITLDDSVRMALLVVLEQLSPAERTSLVLHDFFALSFEEIAGIVGRSPAACRQLASRARRRIQADPETPRTPISRSELEEVAQSFAAACSAGAIEPLIAVLDPAAVGDFDSGGAVPGAPLRAVDGGVNIARVLVAAFARANVVFEVDDVNGDPGVVVRSGDQIVAVIALAVHDGRVVMLHGIGNPDKLTHLRR